MATNYKFISLDYIINKIRQHPLLSDINPEVIIEQSITVCRLAGIPSLNMEDLMISKIVDGMAILPKYYEDILDLYYTKKEDIKKCNMSNIIPLVKSTDRLKNHLNTILRTRENNIIPTYSINGNIIHINKNCGNVIIIYSKIATDERGIPMILDNESLLLAIENYIKKEKFIILSDLGLLKNRYILDEAKTEYAWYIGQVQTSFVNLNTPGEVESFVNDFKRLYLDKNDFYNRSKYKSIREILNIL